ncbi:MAG: hypothetical protein WBV94_02090 [Blastocatellia bacterium]
MDDTKEIDKIICAIYEIISGPAGQARDWDRLRVLYMPEARMIRTEFAPDGSPVAKIMSMEQYIEDTHDYFQQNSFQERQIALRIETFGCIAHAFSVYEARHNTDDPEPFKRGINSIQLFHDGKRWRVVNVLWDNEREDNLLPMPPC